MDEAGVCNQIILGVYTPGMLQGLWNGQTHPYLDAVSFKGPWGPSTPSTKGITWVHTRRHVHAHTLKAHGKMLRGIHSSHVAIRDINYAAI